MPSRRCCCDTEPTIDCGCDAPLTVLLSITAGFLGDGHCGCMCADFGGTFVLATEEVNCQWRFKDTCVCRGEFNACNTWEVNLSHSVVSGFQYWLATLSIQNTCGGGANGATYQGGPFDYAQGTPCLSGSQTLSKVSETGGGALDPCTGTTWPASCSISGA